MNAYAKNIMTTVVRATVNGEPRQKSTRPCPTFGKDFLQVRDLLKEGCESFSQVIHPGDRSLQEKLQQLKDALPIYREDGEDTTAAEAFVAKIEALLEKQGPDIKGGR